ncbi:hypothetical protein, partial [Streptomyces sp. SM14]|uniref:hypothetical protein n=1 Tax=Streptomyces sp. SM14 TaxID=1736045 RepID=UPI000CD4BC50
MDINALFSEDGLRAWTTDRRDQHLEDARHYGQIADILTRRLRESPVDGDKPWDRALRARRIARHLRDMERTSKRAAADAEALHTAYVSGFLELPARRERAALERSKRRDSKAQRRALKKQRAQQLPAAPAGGTY